jgi:hypothetical protein
VVAQLENPVAKILRRQLFQNPFEFHQNAGPVWLSERDHDDAVVLGKQPRDGVEEVAICRQQDCLLLLPNAKTARSAVPCSANSSSLNEQWPAS